MKSLLAIGLLLISWLSAQEGEEVYKQKCASCHQLYIAPSKLLENFMEKNNTVLKLTAPSINQISFRLKSRVGDPNGDKEIHKMEIDSFMADYLINPDKAKSICLPEVLKHFKVMPSMEGKISEDEIESVSTFLYNYKEEDYVENKTETLDYEKALKVAKKEHKIILLKLTREDCYFCRKMKREVFSETAVLESLNKDFAVVDIDIGKDKLPLGIKKQVVPTFIFINENEKIMEKFSGSLTKEDFLEVLVAIVKEKGEEK